MEAVVCQDFGEWSIEEVPRPEPGPGEVLIAVARVQLSVTECRLFRGRDIYHHEEIAAHLEEGGARLFGHEFCGEVVATGPGVAAFEPGDRVYPPGKIPCGACRYCEAGFHAHCADKTQIGYDRPGGLSEFVVQPAGPLCRLPDRVTDAEGAALQPLASAVLCVDDAGVATGDVVAVVGTGPMGYNCGQLAALRGAGEVIAIDIVPGKLERAAERGMRPVNAREADPVERVREATDGVGADVVFEAVGGEQAHGTAGEDPLALATRMARDGGTVVQVGHVDGEITIRPRVFRSKSLNWVNPTVGVVAATPNADTGEHAADLVAADRVDVAGYVSEEFAGLEHFERAVDRTLDDETGLGPAQLVVSGDV